MGSPALKPVAAGEAPPANLGDLCTPYTLCNASIRHQRTTPPSFNVGVLSVAYRLDRRERAIPTYTGAASIENQGRTINAAD